MSADKPGSSAEDAKGRPDVQKPPQEQPSTQPVDITGHGAADSDYARTRTRDDVIRETLLGTTGRGETDSNDTRPPALKTMWLRKYWVTIQLTNVQFRKL